MQISTLTYKIDNILIPWCVENKKYISDISVFISNTNKRNPLYGYVCEIRKHQEELSDEYISLLNKYKMTWKTNKPDLNLQIKNELIPWCKQNNTTILDVKKSIKGKANPLYSLIIKANNNKDSLTTDTIQLLDQYKMPWGEVVKLSEKQKENIQAQIDLLISHCKKRHKYIYQIPSMIGSGHNPKYSIISNLRSLKDALSEDQIALLDKYGMPWKDKKEELKQQRKISLIVKNAKEKLLPWCEKNNKKISKIECTSDLYRIIVNLRENEQFLDAEFIELLTRKGMLWKKDLPKGRVSRHDVLEERIVNELIPYLEKHKIKIPQIPIYGENGKLFSLYRIVYKTREARPTLDKDIIALLDKYGMKWEVSKKGYKRTNSAKERVEKELILWCVKNNKSIAEIPSYINGKINPTYMFVVNLRQMKDRLDKDTISLLDKYGMIWEIRKKRRIEKRITEELIPYCQQNDIMIYEITSGTNGKGKPLYAFVTRLRAVKNELAEDIVSLLDKYGMIWETNLVDLAHIRFIRKLTKQVSEVLIPACKENNCNINQLSININKQNDTYYKIIKNLRMWKEELDEDTINLLNRYGMVWEESLIKRKISKVKESTNKQVPAITEPEVQSKPTTQPSKPEHTTKVIVEKIAPSNNLTNNHPVDESKQIEEHLKTLNQKIKTDIVDYCQNLKIKITDIPFILSGTINPRFNFINQVREQITLLSKDIIAQLNQLDMEWKKCPPYGLLIDVISNVIPYCKSHNIKIYQLKPKYKNGEINHIYYSVCRLKTFLSNNNAALPKEINLLLIEYGFYKKRKVTEPLSQAETNHTSPTVEQNPSSIIVSSPKIATQQPKIVITEKPTTVVESSGSKPKTEYYKMDVVTFVASDKTPVLERKNYLNECFKRIIHWMDKKLKYIHDIKHKDELYADLLFITENENLLDDIQLEDLILYGYTPKSKRNSTTKP